MSTEVSTQVSSQMSTQTSLESTPVVKKPHWQKLIDEYDGKEILDCDPKRNAITDDVTGKTSYFKKVRFALDFIDKHGNSKTYVMDEIFVDSFRVIQDYLSIMQEISTDSGESSQQNMSIKFRFSTFEEIETILDTQYKTMEISNAYKNEKRCLVFDKPFWDPNVTGSMIWSYMDILSTLGCYNWNKQAHRVQLGHVLRDFDIKAIIYPVELQGLPGKFVFPRVTNFGKFFSEGYPKCFWLVTPEKNYFVRDETIVDPSTGTEMVQKYNGVDRQITLRGRPFNDPKTMTPTGENLEEILKKNGYFICPKPNKYFTTEEGVILRQNDRNVDNSEKNMILVLEIKNKNLTITFEKKVIFEQKTEHPDTKKKIYIHEGYLKNPDTVCYKDMEGTQVVDFKNMEDLRQNLGDNHCRRRGYLPFWINTRISEIYEEDEKNFMQNMGEEFINWYKSLEETQQREDAEDFEEDGVDDGKCDDVKNASNHQSKRIKKRVKKTN